MILPEENHAIREHPGGRALAARMRSGVGDLVVRLAKENQD
jgi:hypothetical protein